MLHVKKRPTVCTAIAELMHKVESIRSFDSMLDTLEQIQSERASEE